MRAPLDQIEGVLFGTAYGDAMGAKVEFIRSTQAIVQAVPPRGPTSPEGDPARVTDDTQMMLAVGRALVSSWMQGPNAYATALRQEFVRWFHDPQNTRAPGNTCLSACQALDHGLPWPEATVMGSKGCGANMRVQPVGLTPGPPTDMAARAQLQAAMTHGHPTALTASELTAMAIFWLARGLDPEELVDALLDHAHDQQKHYHQPWLAGLWEQTHEPCPQDYIHRGWQESIEALRRVKRAMEHPEPGEDPCIKTGDGWIAEEALATGLHAFLLFKGDPVAALNRASVTRGDSDSIACLTGAFAGATHGMLAWPPSWRTRIEYAQDLGQLAAQLARLPDPV